MSDDGGSRRRSGRRMHEPLQHIGIGGGPAGHDDEPADEPDEPDEPYEPSEPAGSSEPAAEPIEVSEPAAPPREREPVRTVRTVRIEERGTGAQQRRTGLDRIRPRGEEAGAVRGDLSSAAERDPLGRAALYSSGPKGPEPVFGTFLLECSACRRETPVTAGDLVRLGVPSIHLPFLKRFPSLMRCPACGRRTWLRIHWRI